MRNPDITYYSGVNPHLFQLVPENMSVLVEIGCGAGNFGAAYKKSNPASFYAGVEVDEEAANLARLKLDQVFVGDAQTTDLSSLAAERGIDCFVYGDSLEHMVDPWSVVKTHASLLRVGGKMIASIPNVQHWTVIHQLLLGTWNYTDTGIMDRTHLRFFTLEGMRRLFTDAGMTVSQVYARSYDMDQAREFCGKLGPVLGSLGLDNEQFLRMSAALQFMIYAEKQQ